MKKQNNGKYSGYLSRKVFAGTRRYFFDVRSTKGGDFFLTITESKKRHDAEGYESHKVFLYKEDFKAFMAALNETVDYVKAQVPDFDFNTERPREEHDNRHHYSAPPKNDEVKEPVTAKAEPLVTSTSPETTGTAAPQITDDEQIDWG